MVNIGNNHLYQAYVGHLDEFLFWKGVKNAEFVRMLYELEPKIGNVIITGLNYCVHRLVYIDLPQQTRDIDPILVQLRALSITLGKH